MHVIEKLEDYRRRGWVSIPVKPRTKEPQGDNWQNLRISDVDPTEFQQNSNLGILLGEPSGGLVDIDLDCPEAMRAARVLLPTTGLIFGRSSKPASHYLYMVADAGRMRKFQFGSKTLVEYRAGGGHTLFPPSTHPSGEAVRFDREGEAAGISRDSLMREVGKLAAASLLAQQWQEGSRHDKVMALAGGLLNGGWDIAQAELFVEAVCLAANDPETEDRLMAVRTTAARKASGESATGWPRLIELCGPDVVAKVSEWLGIQQATITTTPTESEMTDIGNAQRFVRHHGEVIRYVRDMGAWLVWNGRYWELDDQTAIDLKAQATAKSLWRDLENASRQDSADLASWARQSNNFHKLKAMCDVAKPHIAVTSDNLDARPYLLNCTNGVIDLQSGQLLPFDKHHWLTKQINVSFNAEAKCPVFEGFLRDTFDGEPELIDFVQRAVGYSLSGDTSEQCFFIAHGTGANGKSTLLKVLQELLGDYACNTPMETLMVKRQGGGIPNDIARLRGARLVTASEGEANQHLAAALVKQITGGDTMTARFLRKEYFEFKPECKLWLVTNHKPKLRGDDPAIWRRIYLIPFNVAVPKERQDGQLSEKLKAELPGILAWAVRGFQQWQSGRLQPPQAVLAATRAYQHEMDHVKRFVDDEVMPALGQNVGKADMHAAYIRWANENGGDSYSMPELHKRLLALSFKAKRGTGGKHQWQDVKLSASLE